MDPKRIFLGYAFFFLGILLTCYQYYHLIDHGPVKPWARQIILIIINTLAVYIGWLLTYPWNSSRNQDDEAPDENDQVHSQRLMSVSLLFCFVTMVGITGSIIMVDQESHPRPFPVERQPVDSTPDLLGQRQSEPVFSQTQSRSNFPWQRYLIAGWYMVGYGILGIGLHIMRWIFRTVFSEAASVGEPIESEPRRAPKKRKAYPIDSMYVLGKIRKKGGGRPSKRPADDKGIE